MSGMTGAPRDTHGGPDTGRPGGQAGGGAEILEVMLLRRVPGATMKCCYSSSDWLAKPKVEARKAECGRPHRAHRSSWLIRPEKVRKAECGCPLG